MRCFFSYLFAPGMLTIISSSGTVNEPYFLKYVQSLGQRDSIAIRNPSSFSKLMRYTILEYIGERLPGLVLRTQ